MGNINNYNLIASEDYGIEYSGKRITLLNNE